MILELEQRAAEYVRFNTEDYPNSTDLIWRSDGVGQLSFPGAALELNAISAVWYRRPVAPVLSPELSSEERVWATAEAREALEGLWRTLDVRWVNHPDRIRAAVSKPAQLRIASELGFDIPKTIVTNDIGAARAFVGEHPAGSVCKPLRSGRIPVDGEEQVFFTTRIEESDDALDLLGEEPYIFQELIQKRADLRVTVIGDRAYAVRIHSQGNPRAALDWRAGQPQRLQHEIVELPDDIAGRCVALVKRFGCFFGAIDLAERPDGSVTFFENNPSGQWAWIEQLTGLPLRARLADLLLDE